MEKCLSALVRERERERRDSERVRKQGTLSEGEADLLIKAACFAT